MRVQKTAIPDKPTFCPKLFCPYRNWEGICYEPRVNKGNGDAFCHRYSNKELVKMLTPND